MTAKTSAGLLLYNIRKNELEVLLVHPGGPFWARKDAGAWSIPKGELLDDEMPLVAAIRETFEETGITVNKEDCVELRAVRLKSGKKVLAWAALCDIPADFRFNCNTFSLEWPPKSGKMIEVPEVDKWEWFPIKEALEKINPAQTALLAELRSLLENSYQHS